MPDAGSPIVDVVDCPDGLARCKGGALERSRLAQIAARSPTGCPWELAGACPEGCVEDVVVSANHATQLCRIDGGPWVEKREPRTCDDAAWACSAAEVIDCRKKQTVAVCLRGCAEESLDEDLEEHDAVTILCAR